MQWLKLTLLTVLVGCGSPTPNTSPKVDGWTVARVDLMADGRTCFHDRTAYCLTDPSFVDPILQKMLDAHFDGKMPDSQRLVQRLVLRTHASYGHAQTATPEARAQVEEKIRAYYDNPTATTEGGKVIVDMGLIPGKLERAGRSGYHLLSSDLLEDGEWRTTEVARTLDRFRKEHPTATTIELIIEVPRGQTGDYSRFTYGYRSNRDQIVVHRRNAVNQAWYTDKLGGDLTPYLSDEASLHTKNLKNCSLKSKNWGDDPGCPLK